MPDKAELAKAIARVESDIVDLRIRLGTQKDALIKQGKRAVWNNQRLTLTKPLYNLLERWWALNLLKHASRSEALYNAKVIGILLPETIQGAIVPPAKRLISTDVMTPNGLMPMRTYDVLQFEASNPDVQPHELKSDAGKSKKGVMASSVKGGITHPDIEVHLRQKSSPGNQHNIEKKLITEASKVPGAKIVVEGTEAVTGKIIRRHVDPQGLNLARFSNYSNLPDVLTLRKPDPADMTPAPPDKPAKKKKAQSTKAKKNLAKTPVTPAKKKPKQVIPAGDLAKAAEEAATVKAAKKQPVKRKVDPKLTAKRGVTPPSPNAAVDVADNAAGTPAAKKQPVKPKAKTPVKVKTPTPSRAITPPSPNTPVIDAADAAKAQPTVPTKVRPTTPPTPPVTPVPVAEKAASVAPSAPKADVHPAPGKGKFSLNLKISPKIKAIGGFILTIGFDLFIGWLEGRRISKMIKALLEENSDKFTTVVNAVATQQDFVKFRFGSNLEKGYQLYFQIELSVTRHCSDGGCGTSGSISEIIFKEVNFSRTKGSDFFPDPQKEKGWGLGGATAVFYQPIFDTGIPVRAATEHAADDDLTEFHQTFILRKKQGIGDYTRDYFDDFHQYCRFFPDSKAGKLFLEFALTDYLNDVTDVELARKPATIMMAPPHNLPFHEVLKWVRWGLATRMSLIVDYYQIVIQMRPEYAIYYLELYDSYFKQMDDGYRKCDSGCHRMTGDKRIIHRLTADDFRMKYRSSTMLLGSERLVHLQNK